MNFVLSVSDDNKLGALGLKIPHNFPEGVYSFIDTLKNNSIISSPVWTLKYYSNKNLIESINDIYNPIGELIIGGDPHDYEENKSKYPKDEYLFMEAPVHSYKFYWDLKIKSVYSFYEKEKVEIINNNYRTNEVSLKSEYSVIWGPEAYHKIIYEYFFNKYEYIKNNICQEKNIPQKSHLKYIECINNNKLFDIQKYPTIYFESFEFNKIFELTYKDLFVLDKETNMYIYLIIFPTNYIETVWSLGIPFLRKYQFTFNEDKKVIGFYNIDGIKQENKEKENKIWIYILLGIVFIIFCGLLVFIGMILHKFLYGGKRRKKANELDDGYDYDTKESINSDKKNIEENKNENLIN